MQKSDEFDEWWTIRQSFPFQSFPFNTFPMKVTINSSKFCSSNFLKCLIRQISSHFCIVKVLRYTVASWLYCISLHTYIIYACIAMTSCSMCHILILYVYVYICLGVCMNQALETSVCTWNACMQLLLPIFASYVGIGWYRVIPNELFNKL